MSAAELGDPPYVNLVTFRRSGVGVQTPVWGALADGVYYVFSAGKAGKIKRLRNNQRVQLAECDFGGKLLGEFFDGSATIIADRQHEKLALAALRRKYGWRMWLADVGSVLTGKMKKRAYLAIELDAG